MQQVPNKAMGKRTKSILDVSRLVPASLTAGTLLPVLILLAATLRAQTAGISSIQLLIPEPQVFDTAGNLYGFQYGPVTAGAIQETNGGGTCLFSNGFFDYPGPCTDAYVGKMDAFGNLAFGTWLGGTTNDQTTALAVDTAGNIYFTGTTGGGFPTTAGVAIPASTTSTAFVAKISPDGTRLLYSTYLPAAAATPNALAVDAQGNAYIAGKSSTGHAFILKLNSAASAFVYNVSLAGSQQDAAALLHADGAGNLIVAGVTTSPDFPISSNALQSQLKGAQNLFISRLDPTGHIVYTTYFGGSGTDIPAALQTDSAGNIYLAGQTSSLDFPTTSGSFEPKPVIPLWNNTSPAGFTARLTADATALTWSTYVMSADHPTYTTSVPPHQGVVLLAVTPAGDTYISGLAGPGFPITPSAPQPCYSGPNNNIFIAHLDSRGALADATYLGYNVGFATALSVPPAGAQGQSILLAWSQNNSLRSTIHFGGSGSTAPSCLSPSVLNSATFNADVNIVPGEFISLTGFGIGPDTGTTSPSVVQVLFDGKPAPVLYAQSQQINAQAPVELNGEPQTSITVVYGHNTFGPISAKVAGFGSAGIFRLQPGGSSEAAAVNQDGTINTPSNPASRGSVVSLWGTGFGLINPPCATGGLNPPAAVNLAPGVSVAISDNVARNPPVNFFPVLYAGSAPFLNCGIIQINFQIPTDTPPGVYTFSADSLQAVGDGSQYFTQSPVTDTLYVK
jgi:uncharacterized protein (TIGR03437 family)